MRHQRRTKRKGAAAKESVRRRKARRLLDVSEPRAVPEGRVSERGRTSEPVAKRRLRSVKRETGGGKDARQGNPVRAEEGQRRARRGTRLRQRRT